MPIDPAGWPFIGGTAGAGVILAWWGGPVWAVPLVVIAAFFAFFFRDPDRLVPTAPDLVVSPADGRVLVVGAAGAGAPAGDWVQVSVFLSPLDVHVNRTPVEGRVVRVAHQRGRFLPAYRADAGLENERTEVWFDRDGTLVICRQIVGILARRIVTRLEPGQAVARGQRFGIMKFGSRIDLFLPPAARLHVRPGDRVVGGESTVATLVPADACQEQAQAMER
jgi:phosphatidylserine decarboxylase